MQMTIRKGSLAAIAAAGLIALLAIVASTTAANPNQDENKPQSTLAQTDQPQEPTPIKLSGKNRQATSKFNLEQGLAIVRVTNQGKSNFVVSLVNSQGEESQTWFNEIGKYEAARGFEIRKTGEYLLKVESDGAWSFNIEQPRPTTGESTPKSITGKQTDVSPFLALKQGLAVFKYNYQGEGRFAAFLTDINGRTIEQLVNTLKATDGSTSVKVPEEGLYFINVTADSAWQIDVQ